MFVPCTSCGQPVKVNAQFCPACGREHPAREIVRPKLPKTSRWQASFDGGIESVARGDFQSALAQLSQAIVDSPKSQLAKCHATRGYAYLRMRQYERALSDCDEAIKLDPTYGEAIAWRGSARAGLSHWREAIEDLKTAIDLLPQNALEYEQVALSLTEDAILDFRQRVKSGDASCQLFHDRGVIYAFRGELEKAIRDLTQAIEANASHAPSYFARAECLSEAGRRSEALDDCTAAIAQGFNSSEVYRLRSILAEENGDLDLALSDLNNLLRRQSNDTASLRRRAQIHARQQKFDRANRDYTHLVQLDDSQPDVFVARGVVRSELGDYWGAIVDFSHSLGKVPSDAETFSLRGEAKLALKRTKQALEDFDAALEIQSACTSAHRGRALVYSACGRHEQALGLLDKALRLDPRYGLGFAAKGRICQELQQFDTAIEAYNEALKIIGDGRGAADTYYRRGVCFAATERWQEAADDFDEAVRRRQTHAGSYVWRANVRFRIGDWRLALDDLAAASKLNPTNAEHYRKLAESACLNVIERLSKPIADQQTADKLCDRGLARHFIGQIELALDDFNVAIQLNPSDVTARIHRANILRDSGAAERAIADYDDVIRIEPRNATHRLERAICQVALGNGEQALADLNSAIELNPNAADAYLQRAMMVSRQGRVNSALSDLRRSICLAPQQPEAYHERAKIRAAKKQYAAAMKDLNQAIERAPHLHQAVLLRAELYSRAGDNKRALTDFEAAVQSGQSVQAHCGRALTLARLGKHDVALRELTKVLRLFEREDLAALLGCRAKIAFNAGQFRRALSDFEVVLASESVGPQQRAQSMYGRGLAMFQLEDTDGAKESMRQAVALDATIQAAANALDWLEGKTDKRPGQLDRPRTSVKLHTPPLTRSRIADVQADDQWNSEPPWNLWLVTSSDSDNDLEFGPIEKSVLDRWCEQGRIDEHTLLLRTDWDQWKWASDIYPQLGHSGGEIPCNERVADSGEPGDADSGEPLSFPKIQA